MSPRNLSQWVREGFNACLISYGERSSGKTATMFGLDDGSREAIDSCHSRRIEDVLAQGGVALALLKEFYLTDPHAAASSSGSRGHREGGVTVALSAWTLRGQQVIE